MSSPAAGTQHCALLTPARSYADREPGTTREASLQQLVLINTMVLNDKDFHATNHVQRRAFNSPQGQLHPPPVSPAWGRPEEPFILSTPACQQGSLWFSFSVTFASHFWNYAMFIPFSSQE